MSLFDLKHKRTSLLEEVKSNKMEKGNVLNEEGDEQHITAPWWILLGIVRLLANMVVRLMEDKKKLHC